MILKQRNIATCIVLSFVTFGFYTWYWKAKMVDEINYLAKANPKPSGVVVVLLSIVTCGIYQIIWDFNAGNLIQQAEELADVYNPSNHGVIYLVLDILSLGLVTHGLMQFELNKILEKEVW